MTSLGALTACSGRHDPAAQSNTEGQTAEPEAASSTLTIKGSDTMVILAQRWAERFMENNAGATLQVSGGGSGTGIAALINGTADIANASRPMKDRERAQVLERRGGEAHETRVALDALAVYVQADNPVQSLTIPQIRDIFRGTVTNWSQVGGPDHEIVLYSRENNSGTYAYFKEHVLEDMDFATSVATLPGTAAVINAVGQDRFGIGYGGIAYATGVRAIRVAAEGGEPIEPNMTNATNGTYPLSRFLYVYTAGEPTGLAQQYIAFVLSEAGQSIVEGVGYYPLPDSAAAAAPSAEPAAEAPAADAPTDEAAAEPAEAPAAEAPAAEPAAAE
ncbi:MAG: PstS family phosphate ABC transporter substrate-binding protein [Polyangiales bacterium]|nr:PstS family phosphate ABC transporter substrate-binding protein [Myxococcales bacterium]